MARRRKRTVKARRRAPARRRSTRAGGRRITARRAYRGLPARRRRSNPKGIFQTPAARYSMWAAGGAASAVVLEQTPLLKKQLPNPLARSLIMAAVVLFVGRGMKGKIRENSTAYAIGFVIPGVTGWVGAQNFGAAFKFGNNNNKQIPPPVIEEKVELEIRRRLGNPGHGYGAANAQVSRISNGGLRAL